MLNWVYSHKLTGQNRFKSHLDQQVGFYFVHSLNRGNGINFVTRLTPAKILELILFRIKSPLLAAMDVFRSKHAALRER